MKSFMIIAMCLFLVGCGRSNPLPASRIPNGSVVYHKLSPTKSVIRQRFYGHWTRDGDAINNQWWCQVIYKDGNNDQHDYWCPESELYTEQEFASHSVNEKYLTQAEALVNKSN